jgi:hypothetical protein
MESEDYPRTLAELEARFSSEEACREYFFKLRGPQGFRCPRCGVVKAWPLRSGRWQCVGSGYQVSATARTVFQDTRTPLAIRFRAIWLMTSQKNGISALGLRMCLAGQLPNRMDVLAQATAGHDPAWTGTASRHGRMRLPESDG